MKLSAIYRLRRIIGIFILLSAVVCFVIANPKSYETNIEEVKASSETAENVDSNNQNNKSSEAETATTNLAKLEIKGRAPKTNYKRNAFYETWPEETGCNLRQRIILRDFGGKKEDGGTATADSDCNVTIGTFYKPYTGEFMTYVSKAEISKGIQIDHIVALSNAWQTGAQYKTAEERYSMATDPLNLVAVDASANQEKSDGDAATWLPKNKSFRCQYIERQVAVKYKYGLWVTQAEHDKMSEILTKC